MDKKKEIEIKLNESDKIEKKNKQESLFDLEIWKNEWKDMPEFTNEDLTPHRGRT